MGDGSSSSIVFPIINIPKFIDNSNREAFLFIEFYFRNDNKRAESFVELTTNVYNLIVNCVKPIEAYQWLMSKTRGYIAEKEAAKTYSKGSFIDNQRVRFGNHVYLNQLKNASICEVELKINLLKQLLDWLKDEKVDLIKPNNMDFTKLDLHTFLDIISELDEIKNKDFGIQYHSLSKIDVYNYLRVNSNGFDKNQLLLIRSSLDVFISMTYEEDANVIATHYFYDNELTIPEQINVNRKTGVKTKVWDYEKMRSVAFPFNGCLLYYLKDLVSTELQRHESKPVSGGKISNEAKKLFCKLVNAAISEDEKRIGESPEKYTRRICEKYKIDFAVRSSKYWVEDKPKLTGKSQKDIDALMCVQSLILPKIPNEVNSRIQEYINTHFKEYT